MSKELTEQEEIAQGEWKIILGKEKSVIKAYQGSEGRTTIKYQILTHAGRSFEIHDYEEVKATDEGQNETTLSKLLEIQGRYYKRYGKMEKYPTKFNDAIDCYIQGWKHSKPQYDITDVKTAIKFYKELIEIKNELLEL